MLEEELENLRFRRHQECFVVINRGKLWYDQLTESQLTELLNWYHEWLDITETYEKEYNSKGSVDIETIIPAKPTWIGRE